MATTLAHDVFAYSVASGSPVFACSLDAEGAFDALPHSVILDKAIGVIPAQSWNILHNWYANMCVFVRWNNQLGKKIPVRKGTRQGGLTSPYLYNLYYKNLIDDLNDNVTGVVNGDNCYNAFCYADDILLCSTTITGLQNLINISVDYVVKFSLRFNPIKTVCTVFGTNPFDVSPMWTIDNVPLPLKNSITYHGTTLSGTGGSLHIDSRIRSSHRAFFSLQGAGLRYDGVSPGTALEIYRAGVLSVLTYGCSAIHLTKTNIQVLENQQCKFLKCILSIGKRTHNTPILSAIKMDPMNIHIQKSALNVFKSSLICNSKAQKFHLYLIGKNHYLIDKTLYGRSLQFSKTHNFNLFQYIMKRTSI